MLAYAVCNMIQGKNWGHRASLPTLHNNTSFLSEF